MKILSDLNQVQENLTKYPNARNILETDSDIVITTEINYALPEYMGALLLLAWARAERSQILHIR